MNKTQILDLFSNKKTWLYYKLYTKTQWYSPADIEKLRLLKLKKLLAHCYDNVPYYKSLIDKKGIDIYNFSSVEVLNKFPILTKEIIQNNFDDFTPKNINKIKGVKVGQTGGTTGNILYKRNDSNSRSSVWATFKRYQDWMGLNSKDKTLILMGGHVKKGNLKNLIKEKLINIYKNAQTVDIYDTSDSTVKKVIDLIKSNKFTHIRAYPQFLYAVALKLEQMNMTFNIGSISTTAEAIMPEHRTMFKKIFNCDSFDQYGCGEIGGIAYECEKHEGLHIAEEHVIVEFSERNELIITDLDNYSMPFIRYWNADEAIPSEYPCSCGRSGKLIKQVIGRSCDYVIGKNDQYLHWAYFWHLIFDSNVAEKRNLKKFQIVQFDKEKIAIRLVSDELSLEEKEFIVADMKKRLGDISIEFRYELEIENSKTGKYRPVVNKLL